MTLYLCFMKTFLSCSESCSPFWVRRIFSSLTTLMRVWMNSPSAISFDLVLRSSRSNTLLQAFTNRGTSLHSRRNSNRHSTPPPPSSFDGFGGSRGKEVVSSFCSVFWRGYCVGRMRLGDVGREMGGVGAFLGGRLGGLGGLVGGRLDLPLLLGGFLVGLGPFFLRSGCREYRRGRMVARNCACRAVSWMRKGYSRSVTACEDYCWSICMDDRMGGEVAIANIYKYGQGNLKGTADGQHKQHHPHPIFINVLPYTLHPIIPSYSLISPFTPTPPFHAVCNR